MVSIEKTRQICGEDLCIAGQFDPVAVLLQGNPEIIKEKVKEEGRQAGEKHMICPGCEVPPDTPMENLLAFCPGKQ